MVTREGKAGAWAALTKESIIYHHLLPAPSGWGCPAIYARPTYSKASSGLLLRHRQGARAHCPASGIVLNMEKQLPPLFLPVGEGQGRGGMRAAG